MIDRFSGGSGRPIAARFSLVLDGEPYVPEELDANGLRFVSIHKGKSQRFTALYSRGEGAAAMAIPKTARSGAVSVAKGFEYLPVTQSFDAFDRVVRIEIRLKRWIDLAEQGWRPAEEHLHYERLEEAHDRDWLTLLAGDDLTDAHFMVLKGGAAPGVWAQQYAYGPEGEASDGDRFIRPGEEYRDSLQGHINLLGVSVCRARQPDEAENTAWKIGGSFLRPQGQVILTSIDQFVEKDLLPLWQREKASILGRLKNDDAMSRGRREELEAIVKHTDREIALGQKRPTGQAIRTMAHSIKKAQNTGLPMRPEPWLARRKASTPG